MRTEWAYDTNIENKLAWFYIPEDKVKFISGIIEVNEEGKFVGLILDMTNIADDSHDRTGSYDTLLGAQHWVEAEYEEFRMDNNEKSYHVH